MNEERLRLFVSGLFHEVEAAKAYRAAPKGGQQVPFHGDFANVPPSGLSRLNWWLREIGYAMNEHSECVCGHIGRSHVSAIGKCSWHEESNAECACEGFASAATNGPVQTAAAKEPPAP
jgi:hypothetical protein